MKYLYEFKLLLEYLLYSEWGFIDPIGKIIYGDEDDVKLGKGDGYLGLYNRLHLKPVYNKCIRFSISKYDDVNFVFSLEEKTIQLILKNLQKFVENKISHRSKIYVDVNNIHMDEIPEKYEDLFIPRNTKINLLKTIDLLLLDQNKAKFTDK